MPWPPVSTSVRLDLFRKQIQQCEREHRLCAHRVPAEIPNLQVIDCSSRKIVAAPQSCVYLALSYVWGRISRIPAVKDVLPASIHSTIEDALIVTQELGYNYLWVDQYCIDQEASDTVKAGQLAQMNSIYNNAQVTIIAASGVDVTSGLPGVRCTTKSETFIRSRENITLCTSVKDLYTLTNESVWMSRAWTMQEAMFAHRRLIFTEDQVFLQCRTQCYGEPQCLPHGVIQWPIFSGMPIPLATDLRDNIHGLYFFAIPAAITTYTRRHLTEASDVLHALQGLLSMLCVGGYCNYWGVIEFPSTSHSIWVSTPPIERSYVERLVLGLSWTTSRALLRRRGFPSWSWAGWEGEVSYPSSSDNCVAGTDIEVSAENNDGGLLPWHQARQSILNLQAPSFGGIWSPYIHIKARCIPISINPDKESPTGWTGTCSNQHRSLSLSVRIFDSRYLDVIGFSMTSSHKHWGMLLSPLQMEHNLILPRDDWNPAELLLIVIIREDQHGFERVGHVYFDMHECMGERGRYLTIRHLLREIRNLPWAWRTVRLG